LEIKITKKEAACEFCSEYGVSNIVSLADRLFSFAAFSRGDRQG